MSRLRLRASTPSLPASSHIRMAHSHNNMHRIRVSCPHVLTFENSRMRVWQRRQAEAAQEAAASAQAAAAEAHAHALQNTSNFLEDLKAQNELMQIFIKSEGKRVVFLARHQPSVELALPLRAQIRRYRLKTYSAERDFAAWRVRRRCLVARCRAVQFELRAGRALPCASRALVALSPITVKHT